MITFVSSDRRLVSIDADLIPAAAIIEGVDWIKGKHDESSSEGQALLAAHMLVGADTCGVVEGWEMALRAIVGKIVAATANAT